MTDIKQWENQTTDDKTGNYNWDALFDNEDYNNDGMIDMKELYLAGMRAQFDEEAMREMFEQAERHAGKEGRLSREQYMMMIKEYMANMYKDHGSDRGDGPRMEMSMETLPDGTERMTIVMEGAQKLAFSAAALAAASFFAY